MRDLMGELRPAGGEITGKSLSGEDGRWNETRETDFNAEHAKDTEKRREEILCESPRFSAASAFNDLRLLCLLCFLAVKITFSL